MKSRRKGWRVTGLLIACLVLSCSEDRTSDSSKMEGDLPCNATPVECRSAFWDIYEGTYAGDASGRLLLDIDFIGGVEGSVARPNNHSDFISGRVNEYGRLEFTSGDGTEWVGQFTANKRFAGTWSGPDGNGTFEGIGSKAEDGEDTSSDPNTDPVVIAARALCDAVESCDDAMLEDFCDAWRSEAPPVTPDACRDVAVSAYTCRMSVGCEFDLIDTVCESEEDEFFDCLFNYLNNQDTPADDDPGTGFEPTGNRLYDEATITCSACFAEASACREAEECFEFAECTSPCTTSACLQRCLLIHEEGYDLWQAASDCHFWDCDGY